MDRGEPSEGRWRMSRACLYILDNNNNVIPCNDIKIWGEFYYSERGIVGSSKIRRGVQVSTIFLGMNHDWLKEIYGGIFYETRIFGGGYGGEFWRWRNWEEAESGHKKIVDMLKREERWGERIKRFFQRKKRQTDKTELWELSDATDVYRRDTKEVKKSD